MLFATMLILCSTGWAAPNDQVLSPTAISQVLQEEVLQEEEGKKKEPLYPPLSVVDREKFKRILVKFKNRNAEKRHEAEQEMTALGRGAIPHLVEEADTRHEAQGECILNTLLHLTDARDIKLLEEAYRSKTTRLRFLAARKIGEARLSDSEDFLVAALKDEDPSVRYEAALGLIYLGKPAGLKEAILKRAEDRKRDLPRLFENLPLLKGRVNPNALTPLLVSNENPEVRISAVEVIAAIGDTRLKGALGQALSDPHNLVQAATVNALRKLVKNEEPREYTNVFELVEEVNQWKKELGLVGR